MDVNGLCTSDEFRMRSLAVWLCIGIVVLGAFGVDSRTNRGYHVIHGQAGPIFRNVVPTIGYSNVGPQIIGRRQNRQDPDEDEDDEEEEEEEEDEVYDPFAQQFVDQGGYSYGINGEEGDEDEDEDEDEGEDEGDGEYDENDDDQGPSYNEVEGRQAFIDNQYVDRPTYPSPPRSKPHTSRVPVKSTSSRKPVSSKPVKPSTTNNNNGRPTKPVNRKPTKKPSKVRPSPHKQQATLAMKDEVITQKVETEQTTPTTTTNSATSSHPVHNEKIQLRPVATSTQFIATPVADLILRLSISIAKPVGQGHANTTSFNVPIRIHHTAVPAVESNVKNVESTRAVEEAPKTETTQITAAENHDDVDESEEDVETVAVTVTELPRK